MIVWEANIVDKDAGSTMAKNLRNIQQEFDMCPWTNSGNAFKKEYRDYIVPEED